MRICTAEQNSPQWYIDRCGIPTGSNADKMINYKGEAKDAKTWKKYAHTLAADKFAGKPVDHWDGNKYTERGHEVEAEAASWYALKYDVDPQEVGFCTNDLGTFGASPDRLIGDTGVLEIKCLPAGHLDAILFIQKNGRAPAQYLPQTYMEKLVCEREWCDLLFYHRDLPKQVVRVHRDAAIDAALKAQIAAVSMERDSIVEKLNAMGEAA